MARAKAAELGVDLNTVRPAPCCSCISIEDVLRAASKKVTAAQPSGRKEPPSKRKRTGPHAVILLEQHEAESPPLSDPLLLDGDTLVLKWPLVTNEAELNSEFRASVRWLPERHEQGKLSVR